MNTSKKSQSVVRVSSLAEFIKWVAQIGGENMLFRGLPNVNWNVESSLCRRLKFNGVQNIDSNLFLEMTQNLLKHARADGHDIKNDHKLTDLELLAELQHYGAATCLIDFTKNSLVALCFACESVDNKNGKIVAFNIDNTDLYNEISIESSNKKIEHWFVEHGKNKKLWILSSQKLNNRIASQQSVFVFGCPTLPAQNFYTCEITNKKAILEELKKYGISANILFDGIAGFSAQNSHSKKYENWDTDSDFVSGMFCQESGDFESAIKYYDQTIKSNPKFYEAYNNRGISKKNLLKFQDAIRDYDEAIRLNPKSPIAYNNRGNAKEQLDKFQDAINDYDEAIKLNPKNSTTYYNRGNAKNNLGKFQDAICDYDEAIRLNLKDSVAYYNRGNAKNNLGKFQDAISDYDEAIRLNLQYYDAYANRGVAKSKLNNLQDAISDFDNAINLNSQHYEAYYNRGLAKSKLGILQDAIHDYDEAIKLNPQYYDAYNNRGVAKSKLENFQGAIHDYDEAIKLNPQYHDAYYNRALAKHSLGNLQDAIYDYDKVIKLNSNNSVAHDNRKIAKSDLDKFKDSVSKNNDINLNYEHHESYNNNKIANSTSNSLQNFTNKDIKPDSKKNLAKFIKQGLEKLNKGDIKGATADFIEAQKIDPEFEIPDLSSDDSDE